MFRAWPVKALLLALFLFLIAYMFRTPIMESAAVFLIKQDPLEQADVAFVLGGSSLDRGSAAALVFKEGYVPLLVTTGENISSVLEIKGINESEAQLTRQQILNEGVPSKSCLTLDVGTSTMEEANAILDWCLAQRMKKVMVISNKYHLRRIHRVFRPMFAEEDIELILHGCENSRFDEMKWWQSEEGLIATNNEYMKLLYYWFKY